MAVTAQGTGTQTSVVTTEHTLLDVAVAGVFQLVVDLQPMADGDIVELRVWQIVLTGGTRHVAFYQAFFDNLVADDEVQYSDPIGNELTDAGSLRFTLKQTAGSARNYPWKVLKYQ